jgi:LysM repeat protein
MFFKRLNIFVLLVLVCISLSGTAQNDGKSKVIQTINNKKYYIHKVEKGQSIYAISKIYGIELNVIFIDNPDAIDGIKTGQELKIPFAKEAVPVTSAESDKYTIHKVSKSETVYGICKKYGISEARFAELNPDVKQGLKEGQIVRVGIKGNNSSSTATTATTTIVSTPVTTATTTTFPNDSVYIYHTVEQGESLYGITKKYTITPEDLAKWNPEISAGIKTGQKLKVGEKKGKTATTVVVAAQTIIDTTLVKPKKQNYNVGVFLPFHLNETDLINVDQLVQDKQPFPVTQQITLDFYEGMVSALDSLKSPDFNVSYQLYDVDERDSLRLDKMCTDEKFKALDLIIGPLYTSAFKVVSGCAKNNAIPIVSPVAQQNKILFDNPYSSKTTPANSTLIEGLAQFAVDSCRGGNVVIVNMNRSVTNQATKIGKSELGMIRGFKVAYNEYLASKYSNATDTLKEVLGLAGAKAAYAAGKKNYYVVLSDDQVFLSDFITQLYVFSEKKENYVMGLRSWVGMENVDPEHLNKLNFTYACPSFIDMKSPLIKKLTIDYRSKYYTDPGDFFYQGYDIAFYYLSSLKAAGPSFYNNLETNQKQGAVMSFNFFRPSETTGFDNKSVQVIRYRDYQFQKVK